MLNVAREEGSVTAARRSTLIAGQHKSRRAGACCLILRARIKSRSSSRR
jgi:hypothetical protein